MFAPILLAVIMPAYGNAKEEVMVMSDEESGAESGDERMLNRTERPCRYYDPLSESIFHIFPQNPKHNT